MTLMQVLPIAVLIRMGGAFGAALHSVVPSFKPELGLFLFGLPHREGRLLWRYGADGFIQRRSGAE